MNNRTIIMIATVAVVMMMGHASAEVTVLSEPAADFTNGTYKDSAVISVVTFGINQSAGETIDNVTVTVVDESSPESSVPEDFVSLKVYKENGTAGFQGTDLLVGTETTVNVDSATTISTTGTAIGTTETTFYVVATLAATPGDTHQFSVDMATDGVATNTSSPTVTALDGSVTAIATIDTTAPTMSSAARVNNTQITVAISESVTNLGAADGGFIVAKNGDPETTYAVSDIAAGGSANLVVLTVADISGSIAAGVKVTYNTTSVNGIITDMAENDLPTDTTGVIVAAWKTSSGSTGDGGGGSGTYPPGWSGTPTPTVTATTAPTASATGTATVAPPGDKVTPAPTKKPDTVATTPAAEGTTAGDAKEDNTPGFTAVVVITGVLAVAYLVMRRRE